MPSVLSTNVSQAGKVPLRAIVEVGVPVVWMVKMPSVPTVKVVLAALVMVGACVTGAMPCTVSVKTWIESGSEPFVPVMVRK